MRTLPDLPGNNFASPRVHYHSIKLYTLTMRLWSLHPKYLDTKGLVALWRETLLAQNVLLGNTKGYKNHPQLIRFKNTRNPQGAIATYLRHVADEADKRDYNFNRAKIINKRFNSSITVTSGQVEYELQHLLNKLKVRDSERYRELKALKRIELHPLFKKVRGEIANWEIV